MNKTPFSGLYYKHCSLVLFDCETTGLNSDTDQIIELAAIKLTPDGSETISKMEAFIKLPDEQRIPDKIVEITGITDEQLAEHGIPHSDAARMFADLLDDDPVLLIAHNAQFDILFVNAMLRREGIAPTAKINMLDTLTVFKDRRPYPHKLEDAITAYNLADKVKNSHRAIDDVHALHEVLLAMDAEKGDIYQYINLFGYNPKYGVNGRRIPGIRYEPQPYNSSRSLVDRVWNKK